MMRNSQNGDGHVISLILFGFWLVGNISCVSLIFNIEIIFSNSHVTIQKISGSHVKKFHNNNSKKQIACIGSDFFVSNESNPRAK